MSCVQPSASRTDLLLECGRPFAPNTEADSREDSEASEYGTRWHLAMYRRMFGGSQDPDVPLAAHVEDAHELLLRWIAGDNPWGIAWTVIGGEQATAGLPLANGYTLSRPTLLDEGSHTYALGAGEIGGTYDLLLEGGGRRCVLDYKTGNWHASEFAFPASMGQMRTLAAMTIADTCAILHTPRGTTPVIYAEGLDRADREAHVRRLYSSLGRVGDGTLKPGPHCHFCPAHTSCPTNDGRLLARSESLMRRFDRQPLSNLLESDPGLLHQLLSDYDKLAKRARSMLRDRVAGGEVIERPDGKTLEMIHKTVESLSKASVVRALGADKAEALLAELRRRGCLEVTEREEMRAK